MEPTVSVNIITYNHAPYIYRCIEGALMQKTTFPYEIVIGEDCSTDGTRQIVFEYASQYPEKIRVITSNTNDGGEENARRADLACSGVYIAYCEGDDYWIDPNKLQKQFEAIQKFDAALVCHCSFVLFYEGENQQKYAKVRQALDESGFISFSDILYRYKHFHTSSIFIKKDIINRLPGWYYSSPAGDYILKVIAAYFGKVYFNNEVMSVYRKGTPGSYTYRKKKARLEKNEWYTRNEINHLLMYKNLDQFMDFKYTEDINMCLKNRHLFVLESIGNLDFLNLNHTEKIYLKIAELFSRPLPNRIRKKILMNMLSRIEY